MSDVRLIRLLNGEDIIGNVTKVDNGDLTVLNPVKVALHPPKTAGGQAGVALVPYCPFSDEKTYTFNREHIIFAVVPVIEFVNHYNTQFGTGLVVPSNNKIILPN